MKNPFKTEDVLETVIEKGIYELVKLIYFVRFLVQKPPVQKQKGKQRQVPAAEKSANVKSTSVGANKRSKLETGKTGQPAGIMSMLYRLNLMYVLYIFEYEKL